MPSELKQPNKDVLGQGKEDRCDHGTQGCWTEQRGEGGLTSVEWKGDGWAKSGLEVSEGFKQGLPCCDFHFQTLTPKGNLRA